MGADDRGPVRDHADGAETVARLNGRADVVITGGEIVDGSGSSRWSGDVAVADGLIVATGVPGLRAREVIDATGMIVAPGFIDAHVHSEAALFSEAGQQASVRQGVTTHIVGQDGFGFAPTDADSFDFMVRYLAGIYGAEPPLMPGGIGAFLTAYDGRTPVNVATLIPNGIVRMRVADDGAGELGPAALEAAGMLIDEAMAEGALGLSSGLEYVPSLYASTDELVAMCRRTAENGGVYVSHIRYPLGAGAALREAVEIGRRAGIPVHVSHLYSDADVEEDRSQSLLAVVDEAIHEGFDVSFDAYPYTYGSTTLASILPGWMVSGGWPAADARLRDPAFRERLRREVDLQRDHSADARLAGDLHGRYRRVCGRGLAAAAADFGMHPVDLACDLLVEHRMAVSLVWTPRVAGDGSAADDLVAVLSHPAHMLCSDGIYGEGWTHPRGYGAFARYVGRFPREGVLSLEEAVRHVTSAPAHRFGLSGRGSVAVGNVADLVVFDPCTFVDQSHDGASKLPAIGMNDVLVGGIPVLRDGVSTGALPGRGLRGGRRRASAFS